MNRLRRSLPPLASLMPFEAAARLESFTRAAVELHLTQAAISRQIRALEDDLGVALFTRGHRAVHLTEAGAELARAVTGGLEGIAACADRLRARRDHDDIVLLAEMYVAMYWLIPRLPAFQAAHPDIRLRVNASTQPLTQAEESFDLALQCSTRPAGTIEPMFSVPDAVFPVCAPSVAGAGTLTARDLCHHRILHCRDDPQDGWLTWPAWLDAVQRRATLGDGTIFDSYPVVLQAAIMGQGIGLGWERGIEHLLADGQLVRPMTESLTLPRGLSLYAAPGREDDDRVTTVAGWLATALGGPAGC
ncbi:LysR family transcriptional regulator [Salinisphaera hydrothermalis]|uniref:LysR family transcriptional regulator n=1 Tax=Salinisphaera hydrothermalis TaxID=563188 RepID=UPI00333F1D8A